MKKVVLFLIVFLVLPFTIKAGVLCTAEDTLRVSGAVMVDVSSEVINAINFGQHSVDTTIDYVMSAGWVTDMADSICIGKHGFWDELPTQGECIVHDTAKEYIKLIEEVCDTSWTKAWNPIGLIRGEQYFEQVHIIDTIKCRIDTVWANKIPVLDGYFYVLPEEYEDFREWVRDWFLGNFVEED